MQRIRESDDLPDDVGVFFVTDVPGSWFQLYGRRAYGELYVGGYLVPARGQASPADEVRRGILPAMEIQCGPDAKRLIDLFDKVYGENIWRYALANGVEPALQRNAQKGGA